MGLKRVLIDADTSGFVNGGPFNQRKLPYANGDGDPNAPLIQKRFKGNPLPGVEQETNSLDGLINQVTDDTIRGGILGATQRAGIDTARITKFMLTPQGLSFGVKQFGLAGSNPKNVTSPRNRQYNLTSPSLQAAGNAFGLHTRRDGLLDLNFEGGHSYDMNEGGRKYENETTKLIIDPSSTRGDKTPLFRLFSNKALGLVGQEGFDVGGTLDLLNIGSGGPTISEDPNFLYDYNGGAHSVLGIGRTKIKRYGPFPINDEDRIHPSAKSYTRVNDSDSYSPSSVNIKDFRSIKRFSATGKKLNSTDYNKYNIENRTTGIGVGNVGLNTNGVDYNSNVYTVQTADKISMLDIYKRDTTQGYEPAGHKDLIKFRIAVVDSNNPLNDNVITFRAFLGQLQDSFQADWSAYQYNGRAESFYNYNSFNRGISFSFQLAAQTRAEMKPLYRKLNYLVAQTAPEYSNRRMRGVFQRLTIGDWCYEVPGFFTSINLSTDTSTPWEIALDKEGKDSDMNELPMVVNVDCSFTPIHNFAPENRIDMPFILPGTADTPSERKWQEANNGNAYNSVAEASAPILDTEVPEPANGVETPQLQTTDNPTPMPLPSMTSGPGSGLASLDQPSIFDTNFTDDILQ